MLGSIESSVDQLSASMDSITLKNNIPILTYKSIELLSKSERKLSKFYKCCSNESTEGSSLEKCFWSGDNVHKFRQHLVEKHENVFCIYCKTDANFKSEDMVSYPTNTAEDCDPLINHMIETHGKRDFQCNRCHYRAITSTHIQLHQISTHYHIWSNNNSLINYESLNDRNQDICKIIVCKPMTSEPTIEPLLWVRKMGPGLDFVLSENSYLCLFCDYGNEEVMEVFVHCVQRHRDFVVCVYHKECQNSYAFEHFEDIPNTVSSDESDEEVMEVPNTGGNGLAQTTQSFKTQCTVECNAAIPGLENDFIAIDSKEKFRSRRHEQNFRNRRGQEFKRFQRGKGFRHPRRRLEAEFDSRRGDNKQWNRNSIEDDFGGYEPDIEDYREPNPSLLPTPHQTVFLPPPVFLPTPRPNPLSVPMQTVPQMIIQTNSTSNTSLPAPKVGGYKEHRLQKQLLKRQLNEKHSNAKRGRMAPMTSTPSGREMPPEIDLQGMESELLSEPNESGIRNNSFKQINRVGAKKGNLLASREPPITYLERQEDVTDEYLDLVNKTVPKRGIKARFEHHNHFELTPLQSTKSTFSDKNVWKCVLCSGETKLRENNIKIHLRSVHNTDSSLKCGYCDFIGQRPMIVEHSKLKHPMAESKIEKYIVHCSQSSSIGFTSGTHLEKPKTTARKSTTGSAGLVAKGSKGALTQKIKESTFMGPLRNDRTSRAKNLETDAQNPSQRVHNRTTHSSNIRSKKRLNIESDSEEEVEPDVPMESEVESDSASEVQMQTESEIEIESEVEVQPIRTKLQTVAKKSTAKRSSNSMPDQSHQRISLADADLPTQYFCMFCSHSFIVNDKLDAIEHYKNHLKLGYTCNECRFWCVSYQSMLFHWNNVHKDIADKEMDIKDNMSEVITNWIISFLNNQLKNAEFAAQDYGPNSTGIDIVCPLCVKAATICSMRARPFDALWKVKLHICKHLQWMPMKCNLCQTSNTMFPNNPYLLMKHLIDFHFTSCDNFYNISFRGQKAFNDMKREQLRLIHNNYTSVSVVSSDIINAFFYQLMTELDWNYENQLRHKFGLNKEIRINLRPLVSVKAEPIDISQETGETEGTPEPQESQQSVSIDMKEEDEKKDIKPLVKLEVKSEVKTEVKSEVKSEVKNEFKSEIKEELKSEDEIEEDNESSAPSGQGFLDRLYGDSAQSDPIVSYPPLRPNPNSDNIDIISLSSDDDS